MREEIAENIQRDLNFPADQEMAEAIQHLVLHHLNTYTIGWWVSVEDRLPENGARCAVKGHDNKLFCADHFCNGIWDKWEHEPTVTHWLALDLPKQSNEKGE